MWNNDEAKVLWAIALQEADDKARALSARKWSPSLTNYDNQRYQTNEDIPPFDDDEE